MARKEIFVEEAVLDDISEGLSMVERPLSVGSFVLLGSVIVGVILTLLIYFFVLDIGKGSLYQTRAFANAGRQISTLAPRGVIYDRFGVPLVKNEPSFSAVINLSRILKNPKTIPDELSSVASVIDIEQEDTFNRITSANLERESYILLANNLTLNQTIELKKLHYPWLVIEESFSRDYLDPLPFAHILGYTGFASRDEIKRDSSLTLNDETGKSGLEAFYDSFLRGHKGVALVFQDAKGNIIETKQRALAYAGDNLKTTLDKELQDYFYQALKNQLNELGRTKAVGIVMAPQTGEVLSMVSIPSYNNNKLTADLFSNPLNPTFNRAISGLYSPGSTIKPLDGVAALSENIISPLKTIYSPGYLDVPNPYDPAHPSRFLDWRPQGWVNLYSAIARSSNVYFYEVGGGFEDQQGLGIERLKEYWKKFQLDKKTGIDLLGEKSGFFPDPDWKEKTIGSIWRLGDTYHVAIGQGDLTITPIELVRYMASIATHGKLPTPFVVQSVTDHNGNTVMDNSPKLTTINIKDSRAFYEVEKGMLEGVTKSYGTSYSLNDLPMVIAAKTGSAQIQNNTKTNAFFIGYNIPAKDVQGITVDGKTVPQQIMVLVLIENAKEGSLNAVPVGKEIFQWYYTHRLHTGNSETSNQ